MRYRRPIPVPDPVEDAMGGRIEVLLVDDEEIVGKRLKPALEKHGYAVEFCQSGRQALARLQEKPFDIVVTDIRMDDVDGLTVLETAQQRSPRTRVIMITGYATAEVACEAQVKGAFDFIAKPFSPADLRTILDRAASALKAMPAS
jgi:DNA-binding NtrC family response regulator